MKNETKLFFRYVIPSIFSFALSGVYSIVDGFFVGNSIGDAGLSAINIAYPVVALIQAVGTGIGMSGAIQFSISKAEGQEEKAEAFSAVSLWMLILSGIILTPLIYAANAPVLKLFGAQGEVLSLGMEYLSVIAAGSALQVIGTGLVPFIRNHGGPMYAMFAMIAGFGTNIVLDYLFVWVLDMGVWGAAVATVIGQGATLLVAVTYLLRRHCLGLKISMQEPERLVLSVLKLGISPFGLSMAPNISLVIINKFSTIYGGNQAVAAYAVIAYAICVIYLVLQGVGDGCQPLLSRFYGEKSNEKMRDVRRLAFFFALVLAVLGGTVMYLGRAKIGLIFGTSAEVNAIVSEIMPIFVVSVPFVAVIRITTASFYATEKSIYSYILTFAEPLLMLALMLILPPLFGGQIMVWWSTVFARIISAVLSVVLLKKSDGCLYG